MTDHGREIRAAFDEGFALSKFGGPIETAWERSESRQAAAVLPPATQFELRKLATMLGYLARDMRRSNHARVNVPQTERDGRLGGFDVFSVEDVEVAQLEAERLARGDVETPAQEPSGTRYPIPFDGSVKTYVMTAVGMVESATGTWVPIEHHRAALRSASLPPATETQG